VSKSRKTKKAEKRTVPTAVQRPRTLRVVEPELDRWDPSNWGTGSVKPGEGMPEKFVEPMPRFYDQLVNERGHNPLLERSLYVLTTIHDPQIKSS
jgi:hypothetical protein